MVIFGVPGQALLFHVPGATPKKRQEPQAIKNCFLGSHAHQTPNPILTPTQGKVFFFSGNSFRFNCLVFFFFSSAFPSIIRDCNAKQLSSQVILMRERFQKDYGWGFKCLLKCTQKSLHCRRKCFKKYL